MHERRILTPRTARYVTFGAPPERAAEVWFALHGYGQLAHRFARRLKPLDDGTRLVVVPEGLSRFYVDESRGTVGASWMTRVAREDEIDDYLRYLDAVAEATLPADGSTLGVHVLGFSQGSATACRWVARGAIEPARLVVWGGEIPPDLDWPTAAGRFRALEVLLVAGEDDAFATADALARHAGVLAEHGVPHRVLRYPGGHSVDARALERLVRGALDLT